MRKHLEVYVGKHRNWPNEGALSRFFDVDRRPSGNWYVWVGVAPWCVLSLTWCFV